MSTQKEYWDKKIIEWSLSGYKKSGQETDGKLSFIERLASSFRRADSRLQTALQLLGPLIKNKTALDLGFGMGDFCFGLLEYKPKKVIGIDIAESAVKVAQQMAKKLKKTDKLNFMSSDVATMKKLPDSDLVVGLGFIDYLDYNQHRHLFYLLDDRNYFFSYFEKKISLLNILHSLYIRVQNCPGAYKFTRSEIREIIPYRTKPAYVVKNNLAFITNIQNLKGLDKEEIL